MHCPACGSDNPLAAKFCGQCGSPLSTATPASIPRRLAEKIVTSRTAMEGERKVVTVLFADVRESMELLTGRDPEEGSKLVDPALHRMIEAVHRYEGTVSQVMGEGIMALFGAPLAHEDHALRACYAALRMQETIEHGLGTAGAAGPPVKIRVGLNSGTVVVRSIGSDLRMDYAAVGATTHLAARMEQLAGPGTILLTRDTAALVEDLVCLAPRGPMEIKGLREPVEVFELTGATSVQGRLHAAAGRGLTRLVGRAADLALLHDALARTAGARGQVVAVVGDPGVGKSRLAWELARSPRAQGWLVLETAAVSYGKTRSYLPVVELLKRYFQIDPRDAAPKVEAKVRGKLASGDPDLEAVRPALLELLDVPVDEPEWTGLDPAQRRQRTLEALKALLLSESAAQPLLLVVEDLQWIDPESQALLDTLVDSVPTSRMLVVVTYRPGYTHAWAGRDHYQEIRLDSLAPGPVDELLDALVGTAAELGPLRRLLIERTEGNPFFLEEAVRTLVETATLIGRRGAYRLTAPIESLPLPATAQALIAARIDRLEPESKRLLQAAAVVGRDVPLALLGAILGEAEEEQLRDALDQLEAADFLSEAQIFPELEYTFSHALTHEVAYGSLPGERRIALHAALVAAHERVYAGRLAEHVERLAHHATRGQLWDQAVTYGHAAGRRCIERSTYGTARRYFEDALAAAARLPEGPDRMARTADLLLDLRLALLAEGERTRAFERLLEADELVTRLGDRNRMAIVATRAMHLMWLAGQTERAREYCRRALEHVEAVSEPTREIAAHNILAAVALFWGEYARVETHARRVIELLGGDHARARGDGLVFPAVTVRGVLAAAWAEQGRFATAQQRGEDAVRIAESLRHPHGVVQALLYLAYVHHRRGRHAEVEALCRRGIALAESYGGTLLEIPMLRAFLGDARVHAGAVEEGLQSIREGIAVQTATGVLAGLAAPVTLLGEGLLVAGRLDEAAAEAERARSLAAGCGERRGAAAYHQLMGDIAARRDPPACGLAETSYRQGLSLAAELGLRPIVAHCHLGLGAIYQRLEKRDQAKQHADTAATMYAEMGMTYWLRRAAGA
jgi:class 3 adenylate cyclase/tetratricopeptide (TPR) repeat protein